MGSHIIRILGLETASKFGSCNFSTKVPANHNAEFFQALGPSYTGQKQCQELCNEVTTMNKTKAWLAWCNLAEPTDPPCSWARYALLMLRFCGDAVNMEVSVNMEVPWVKSTGQRRETCGTTLSRLSNPIFSRIQRIVSILYVMIHSKISFGKKVLQELKTCPYETKNKTSKNKQKSLQTLLAFNCGLYGFAKDTHS